MFWKLLLFVIIVLFAVYSVRSVFRHFLYLSNAIGATQELCAKEFRGLLTARDLVEMDITNIVMNALMAANQIVLCYILLYEVPEWLTWKVIVGDILLGSATGAITFYINKTVESVIAPYVIKAKRATDFSAGERIYFSSARENNSRLIILAVTIAVTAAVVLI